MNCRRFSYVAAVAIVLAVLGGCRASGSTSDASARFRAPPFADGTILDVALPPVIDASYADSMVVRDRTPFPCGTVSGAITADLLCDRLFPDLNWDVVPGSGLLLFSATGAPGGSGPDAAMFVLATQGVGFNILTPTKMQPLTETCATLPPPLADQSRPSFNALFSNWFAACDSATEVVPGTSFELVITSVGTLTSDSLGADPLDASADAFDWASLHQEVLSNSFHGTLRATLVGPDGGAPIYVDMTF
jgi:hypothetical protein